MENIDMFITAFKPFKEHVTDNRYKIIGVKDYTYNGKLESYKDNIGDNISEMNGFFSELTAFYWIAKNYNIKEYIGICSYRRYFNFFDNIDSIEDKLNDGYIILPKEEILGKSVIEHYDEYHNINDLYDVLKILCDKYPDYIKDTEDIVNDNKLYCNGMFIMKREKFLEYCEFIFNILFEYLNNKQFKTYNDILTYVNNNKEYYIKNKVLFNSISHQARIGGFLAERLFTIFIKHNFKKIHEIPMVFVSSIESLRDVNETTRHFEYIDKIICPSYEHKLF